MLVDRVRRRRILYLSLLGAGLAAMTSAATLADIHVYDTGLMPEFLLGTLGFDVMSLAVSLAIIACVWALSRRRERFWLVWLGLQGYLLYAYAIYAFGPIYTRFYFLYIAIVGLSAFALAGFALHFDASALRGWRAARLPHRVMGIALVTVAGVFAFAWSMMLTDAIRQQSDIPGAIVLVLDLAFALPLLVIVGVLLYRKRALGDFLATGVFTMTAAITLAVAIGELLRPLFGEPISPLLTAPYLIPGSICLAFALLGFRRVGPRLTHSKI